MGLGFRDITPYNGDSNGKENGKYMETGDDYGSYSWYLVILGNGK